MTNSLRLRPPQIPIPLASLLALAGEAPADVRVLLERVNIKTYDALISLYQREFYGKLCPSGNTFKVLIEKSAKRELTRTELTALHVPLQPIMDRYPSLAAVKAMTNALNELSSEAPHSRVYQIFATEFKLGTPLETPSFQCMDNAIQLSFARGSPEYVIATAFLKIGKTLDHVPSGISTNYR